MTRLIGDIHGNTKSYANMLNGAKSSIQVGDFGIGFHDQNWHDGVNKFHKENPQHRFIRGNHDFPDKCRKEMAGYIPDGTIENNVMFIGGAMSIDRGNRTIGLNWWDDEELSYSALSIFVDVFKNVQPEIVITHDCPASISKMMFIDKGLSVGGSTQHYSRTAAAFDSMFEQHQPKFWFFGHWHITSKEEFNGTTFHCIGKHDFVDFDLENGIYL